MKKTLIFSVMALTFAGGFTSCENDDSNGQPINEQQLLGKWRMTRLAGEEVLTNGICVETYDAAGIMTTTISSTMHNIWFNHQKVNYSLSGNAITFQSFSDSTRCMTVSHIDGNTMEADNKVTGKNGNVLIHKKMEFTRVNVDYRTAVIGTWEGVEMTGDQTYGDANHRWEYKVDGTYVYYNKEGEDWVPSSNVANEYCVDGDFFASRWKNDAASEYSYEWWVITSCTDTEMTWYALREREDGSRYITTFKMKKINSVS